MILAFSTLGTESEEQRFYQCVEDAANLEVTWFQIAAEPRKISEREIRLGWDLTVPQCAGTAAARDSSSAILSPSQLRLWTNRWGRVTRESQDTLELSLQRYASAIRQWYDVLRPSMVLVSSNSVPHTGIPFDLARERAIPTAAFERGYLPESYQISDYGSGPFSNWSDSPLESLMKGSEAGAMQAVGEEEIALLRDFRGRRDAAAEDLPCETARRRDERIRVLFVPVADNTFSVYPIEHPDHARIMPAFDDTLEVARQLYANPRFNVVVKPHPTEAKSNRWSSLPGDWRISHGDVMSWIEWAEVVVCNGTTLELSALARGKPVVLAGRSILSNKGIAEEVTKPAELAAAVETAVRSGKDADRRDRFARFLSWLRTENLIFPQRDGPSRTRQKLLSQLRDYGLPATT
jgi:hypothetical protein